MMKFLLRFAILLTVTGTVSLTVTHIAASTKPNTAVTAQISAATDTQLSADNPFVAPSPLTFHTPPFDKVRLEHYEPAFMIGTLRLPFKSKSFIK